jgi:hypothetical protein
MDRQKLIAALVERHGLKLGPDDPAFLIVDLNLMMLERHTNALQAVAKRIENLPASTEQRLHDQTTQLLQASHAIQQDLLRLAKAVDKHTNTTVESAVKGAQSQIQRAAADAVSNALAASGVDEKVGAAVNDINLAAKALSAHTELALENIKKASKISAKSTFKFIAVITAISLIAALIGGGVARFSVGEKGNSLSAEDLRQLEFGRALDKIWPALTEPERQRINGLFQNTK